jgi:Zn-dependent protease with chaperone function
MNISVNDFIHPEDKNALENLTAIPLFKQSVQAFMKTFHERQLHSMNMAQKIRLGPRQLPELYNLLPPICERFGIQEPEFYLEDGDSPNAYTFGDRNPFITVNSALIENLTEEELKAVIAHECGHILCQHVLYRSMADMLIKSGTSASKVLAALSLPIQIALRNWYRKSEFSADRAAAIYMRDYKPIVHTMIRLSGGPKSITEKVNLDLYIEQAEAYDKLAESNWDRFLQATSMMGNTHPFPTVRSREIKRWCETKQFVLLTKAIGELEAGATCPNEKCKRPVEKDWKFCKACGEKL